MNLINISRDNDQNQKTTDESSVVFNFIVFGVMDKISL